MTLGFSASCHILSLGLPIGRPVETRAGFSVIYPRRMFFKHLGQQISDAPPVPHIFIVHKMRARRVPVFDKFRLSQRIYGCLRIEINGGRRFP